MIFYTTLFHHKCGSKKEYKQQNLTKLFLYCSTSVNYCNGLGRSFRFVYIYACAAVFLCCYRFVRWLKIDINSRHLTLNSNPLTLNPQGGSQRTNWTDLRQVDPVTRRVIGHARQCHEVDWLQFANNSSAQFSWSPVKPLNPNWRQMSSRERGQMSVRDGDRVAQ